MTTSRLSVSLVAIDRAEPPDWLHDRLREHGARLQIQLCESGEEVVTAADGADVVWIFGGSRLITADVVRQLPRCGAILRSGTGTDNVAVDEATKFGIYVANTPETTTDTVAEHAIGLLFAVLRRIALQDRAVRRGIWDSFYELPHAHVTSGTLGLIGFGRIARAVARKMSGFDMRILTFDPLINPDKLSRYDVEFVSLESLLQDSDFVSVHCPLTETTRGLIDENALARIKLGAVLVNTARGELVDEHALVDALKNHQIAGAGLDVFAKPLVPEHPLMAFENVVITPHTGGASTSTYANFWEHSVRTLIAMAKHRRPIWIVNPEVDPPRWGRGE